MVVPVKGGCQAWGWRWLLRRVPHGDDGWDAHPPGQPGAEPGVIRRMAKPPVPHPGRVGASRLTPPREPASFKGQIYWKSPEASALEVLLAAGCSDADPCPTPEGNPSAHPGCWQGCEDATWVVHPSK